MTPDEEMEHQDAHGHSLLARPSRIAKGDLVWECEHCGARGDQTTEFRDVECL